MVRRARPTKRVTARFDGSMSTFTEVIWSHRCTWRDLAIAAPGDAGGGRQRLVLSCDPVAAPPPLVTVIVVR